MDPPNILVLVWDACRYDTAEEHASVLQSLADDNIWFENAIAPAPWTLPSHVSMFTGTLPHEHRIFRPGQSPSSYPLVEKLDKKYTSYGISANPFFSHQTNAHEAFDEFYYTTPTIFADGLNTTEIHQLLGESGSNEESTKWSTAIALLRKTLGHRHPFKSLANLLSVTTLPIARKTQLNRIPHLRFNEHDTFSYSPKRNTQHIERIIRSETDSDGSFFIFANYMDTHRPYVPPPKYQRHHLGRELSYRELDRIDKNVGDTWTHLERLQRGEVTDDELETLRKLYAGTVNSADEHLRQILEILDETGQREDTLVIVTSDHGEDLGESDYRGRQRVGHQMTVSDAVLRVPLVVAHPDLEQATVEEYASLRNLYHLMTGNLSDRLTAEVIEDYLISSDGIVASEYPPKDVTEAYELHPDIPDHFIREEVSEFSVITYQDGWKLILDSNGGSWAWNQAVQRDLDEVPDDLHTACEEYLHSLIEVGSNRTDSDSLEQLESLGYL